MINTDEFISMHKATERVLEDMAAIDRFSHGNTGMIDSQIASLRSSVQTLATIQRDLLAGTIHAITHYKPS